MMTVSKYVMNFLVDRKITDVFTVSGGGIMYLLDELGKQKKLRYTTAYQEQVCATAAESYMRTSGKPAACLVTTGPGSTNAITGVAGAWYDSIPIFVISGQVKTDVTADYEKIRQIAPQEVNIMPMIKPITKYSVLIRDPKKIKYELEKLYHFMLEGKPGPVWLVVPLDIQNQIIDEKKLSSFKPEKNSKTTDEAKLILSKKIIENSKRPLIILGRGIKHGINESELLNILNKFNIPVVTTLGGMDVIYEKHKLFFGRIGPAGQRRANFALQTADLIISLGASLNINTTGFKTEDFARKAKKIVVNIEKNDIDSLRFNVDCAVTMDAGKFLLRLNKLNPKIFVNKEWLPGLIKIKKKYPPMIKDFFKKTKYVNGYVFFNELCNAIKHNIPVVTGMGQDVICFQQIFRVKKFQKAFVNKNYGQMGWCLPAAIGASRAINNNKVILVTGDGSLQFNIHELQTISYYNLPIIIFVFSNNGYKSIRDTQNNLFQGRLVGADSSSGVSNPNFKYIAKSYSMKYFLIRKNNQLKIINQILKQNEPVFCEVLVDPKQERIPRPGTYVDSDGKLQSLPLEDLYPLIPREELKKILNQFE